MSLQITRVAPKDYGKVQELASQWHVSAVKQHNALPSSSSNVQLVSTAVVAKSIHMECHLLQTLASCQKQIYLCEDTARKVHGIIILSERKPQLWIDYVVKNPDDTKQEQGVGRAFCKFIEDKARKEGMQTLCVRPLSSAVPFYLKCGFQEVTDREMAKPVSKL